MWLSCCVPAMVLEPMWLTCFSSMVSEPSGCSKTTTFHQIMTPPCIKITNALFQIHPSGLDPRVSTWNYHHDFYTQANIVYQLQHQKACCSLLWALHPKQLSPRARPAQLAAKAIQSLRNHCQHTRFPGPKNIKPQIWKTQLNSESEFKSKNTGIKFRI